MPTNPAMLMEEIKLNDALVDKRRALVDRNSEAIARGVLLMRDLAQGSWQRLSDAAIANIKAEMAERYPGAGATSALQRELDRNPAFARVVGATLEQSQSLFDRSPRLGAGRERLVHLDRPGVVHGGSRPANPGGSVTFDCRTGRVASMSYPQGLSEWEKPVPLTLAKDWDPSILDRVRWRSGHPVRILAVGEDEPS